MKEITIITMKCCPYCEQAFGFIQKLQNSDKAYQKIKIHVIDEELYPEIRDRYDHFYFPAIFVDGKKIAEGACTESEIQEAFLRASK